MKLTKIRNQMEFLNIDGLFVTNRENIRYLTNFTGSAGVVLITKSNAIFLTDFRYSKQAREQIIGYEIEVCGQSNTLMQTVFNQIKRLRISRLGFETNHITHAEYSLLKEEIDVELVAVKKVVETLRTIKSKDEIDKIRTAASIADSAFLHILNFIRPGVTEVEVSNELEHYMRLKGASSNSSTIIVASGYRSALPHGVASEKIIEKGDMVTLDYGALYQGYRSDMTRTVAVGEPDTKLKEIYQIVLAALLRCTSAIKQDMPAKEVDAIVRDYITKQGYGEYFGHGAGHGIGLNIHEDPFFSKSSDQIVKAGMVVTVEPGIYIPDLGGVRIEDDIVIGDQQNEIITKSPRELIII
ncbi:M24 family metallopeptidase [Bacillus sp. JJ1474]|uniref:M24 family metallopeptidase n=1 Tax=Bacillus sp. JJ1474 TaxID=3122955 RepID=UPI0030004094